MSFERGFFSSPERNNSSRERSLISRIASSWLIKIVALMEIGGAAVAVHQKASEIELDTAFSSMKVAMDQDDGIKQDRLASAAAVRAADQKERVASAQKHADVMRTVKGVLEEEDNSIETQRMDAAIHEIFGNNVVFARSEDAIQRAAAIHRALEVVIDSSSIGGLTFEQIAGETRSHVAPEIVIESSAEHRRMFTAHDIEHATRNLPRGWYVGEVAKITISEEDLAPPPAYGLSRGFETEADFQAGASEITMYHSFFKDSKKEQLFVLYHEIGHANDWSTDNQMTRKQRMELVLAVHERLHAPDRFRSTYVESIHNKDKKLQEKIRAQEYWAEICAQYFIDAHQLNIKDFLLVDGVVRIGDPTYQVPGHRAQ